MDSKQDKPLLPGLWSWFSTTCMHCVRATWYIGVVLFVIAAVAVTVFRFWLPALVDRKAEVENYLSRQVGQAVKIGEMAADWQGLYPSLHARNLVLEDADTDKDVQLSLDELRLDLDIVPLLQGRLVFRQITLKNPVVHVSRSVDGELYIGKFRAPAPKKGRLAAFFRQYNVNISDGRFIWHDNFLKEKPFVVTKINFSMENKAKNHVLEGSLKLPEKTAREVSVKFDINGDIAKIDSWDGNLSSNIVDLVLSDLPGIINEKLSLPVAGILSASLATDWKDGMVESSTGHIAGHDLLIPLGRFGTPFSLRSVAADLSFENSAKSWLLTFDNTYFALAGKPWAAGRVQLSSNESESFLHISKLKLADIRPILDALTSENKIVQLVKSLYPSGKATDVSLTLFGPLSKPDDFLYKMSISEATVNAYKIYPAATGLQADIRVDKNGGSVVAVGKNSRVVLDKVYEHPLRMDSLQANVEWKKEKKAWKVDGKRIWLKNKDAEVLSSFIATIPFDHNQPPWLDLKVDLINGNLSHADHYFPVLLMKPGIRQWFETADFRGRLNTAKLNYDGTVKGFPVAGAKSFDVVANIEAGSMYFSPGWPRLTGIDADLVIGRNDLWVNGIARNLYGQKVEKSNVHLSKLAEAGKQIVDVSTTLHGDLGKVVAFLQSGPLFRGTAFQELSMAASGHGKMKLGLSIPLADASGTKVKGEYQTAKASLQLPDGSWLSDLKGRLQFSERSMSAKKMTGKYLGGPVALNVTTVKQGQPPIVEIAASGTVQAGHLQPLLGEWLAKELQGSAKWTGKIKFMPDEINLTMKSDLKGLASLFPYPLEKKNEEKLPLRVSASFVTDRSTRLEFFMPLFANGRLFFTDTAEGTALTGGCVLIGKKRAACRDRAGLSVLLENDLLDLDPWDNYIKQQPGDEGLPDVLTKMSARLARTYYAGVDVADVTVDLDRQKDASWQGKLNGTRVAGDVAFKLSGPSKWMKVRLQNLIWNEAEKESTPAGPGQIPTNFPSLDVGIENLVFHKMKLGKLSMQGEPTVDSWQLQYLKLDRPEMKVRANGDWRGRGSNQTSSFEVDFTSTDMSTTLKALDFDIDFESEIFHTTGNVSWRGAPYDYELGLLNGKLDINSGKGRLSSVEVGAGKLLGAVNVDSLRRRLLLDFSDLSKEGFAFDEISADMSIRQGIADITKLIMPGPSATIRIEGKVGLVKQDVDMKMSISPAVGGNLAIAGFVLGGPAGGVVTYLASKAIKNQMDKQSNYQYTITGPWEDPVVEKIHSPEDQEAAEDDAAPGG